MQLKLEELLKIKERELKLYQRFIDLRKFCEDRLFPLSNLPLKDHVESLKATIEDLMPEPRDRTEEMFSGEVFTLLCSIYLHDIGVMKDYDFCNEKEVLGEIDQSGRKLLLNYSIGNRLNIPHSAIKIVNYLTCSKSLKRIPIEWEIIEDDKKALIRNTRAIKALLEFGHLLLDISNSDIRYHRLNMSRPPWFVLNHDDTQLYIDTRVGTIHIECTARTPYALHVLNRNRDDVEDRFRYFKNTVNNRFGFQYNKMEWEIKTDFDVKVDPVQIPKFFQCNGNRPQFKRWDEAAILLDRLLSHGNAILIGPMAVGKTTLLVSYVIPQLKRITSNCFYCQLWERPVSEIKDTICNKYRAFNDHDMDIASICKGLLRDGPVFFVLDNCERYQYIDEQEQGKFERFIEFCLNEENLYLILSGDKEMFFDWYRPLNKVAMSAILEITPLETLSQAVTVSESSLQCGEDDSYAKEGFRLNIEGTLEVIFGDTKGERDLRKIMAVLIDKNDKMIKRYTLKDIANETSLPRKRIIDYLAPLQEKGLVRKTESMGQTYLHVANRLLIEPLYKVLNLHEFDEKRWIRRAVQNSIINDTLLDGKTLSLVERWKDDLIFSGEEMGVIIASLIVESREHQAFLEKAKQDETEIDVQPILKVLEFEDVKKRREAIKLLTEIKAKAMINPLLSHLKKEDATEIRDMVIKGIAHTGKKKAMVAIINALKEINEVTLRIKAIGFFYSLLGDDLEEILMEIKGIEEEPLVLERIDSILKTIKGSCEGHAYTALMPQV